MSDHSVTTDAELERAARDKTSYDTSELPGDDTSGQFQGIMQDAKRHLEIRTGSDSWYSDLAYGHALVCMTALKMKEAVENVNISSYGIGDEQVAFSDTDPETSQQIISWSSEMSMAINQSGVSFPNQQDETFQNTGSFIG